ncbi:hypothetical protein BVRB_3g070650 [Beta vulgaris subsp. vulgaris]|uniref:Uncharacterized protein n=1 Tax=Beta vulgaris subsp. vulgaris TaxID=3555 RepID=A0A0J8BF19_BETVV|nr:hypothetical protein BVRB_3g070650 [Beta vulgaris subsp. vulgaris]
MNVNMLINCKKERLGTVMECTKSLEIMIQLSRIKLSVLFAILLTDVLTLSSMSSLKRPLYHKQSEDN